MSQMLNPQRKHIRNGKLPHFFCAGCGCGQILNYFLRAVDDLEIDLRNVISIGGVGCTARIPVYLATDSLHGVHGRTLAWATGIKMHKPELRVVIFAGDGDIAAIGGNHFIQAARRNLDITVIVANNLNFAMTGGQVAPSTPYEAVTMTTPYGSGEPPFDISSLAEAAGATYVSRWTTNKPIQATKAIKEALQHKGFSIVEIISQCPTNFGRYALKTGNPEKVLDWIKERSVTIKQAEKMSREEKSDKFVLGEFVKTQREIFKGTTVYEEG